MDRKLVHERRGGYCFEHNLLIASAFEHLGPPRLMVQTPDRTQVSQLPRETIPELLSERFSLPGFALGADGRVP